MSIIFKGTYSPFDHEVITVSNSAKSLTASKWAVAGKEFRALLTLEADQVRYWPDGTDPTASVGHLMAPSDVIVLENTDQLSKFRAIRVTADATLIVSYFKR